MARVGVVVLWHGWCDAWWCVVVPWHGGVWWSHGTLVYLVRWFTALNMSVDILSVEMRNLIEFLQYVTQQQSMIKHEFKYVPLVGTSSV